MTIADMGWSQIGIRICLMFVALVVGSTLKRPRPRNRFVHRNDPRAPLSQPHPACRRDYIP